MSGGHFDYSQYSISAIASHIEGMIEINDSEEINVWGDKVGYGFSPETIDKFREAVTQLRRAFVYAQRIDFLVSGDDGEPQFHRRLEKDLSVYPESKVKLDPFSLKSMKSLYGKATNQEE